MSDTNTNVTTTPPASTETVKKAEVAKRVIQPITPIRLQLSEHVQAIYVATVERGVSRADMLEPQFWSHVANQLRPRYEIKVYCEDDSFFAHYIVLACDKTWARVHELTFQHLGRTAITPEQLANILADYDVAFRGPRKWSVVRKVDRVILQENMHSKEDAQQWLLVHLNSQSSAPA